MKLGVVGLPNVGKSTLFNALTQARAQAANYPFCTIEPNVGVVAVPDARVDYLAQMYNPQKITPATIEFVDIAGLVKGASRGEGLGNKFLSHIRQVDAIVHVVRCFVDGDVVHVDGQVNPIRDVETINMELLFADMESVERKIERTGKAAKSGDKKLMEEAETLKVIYDQLERGIPVRSMILDPQQRAIANDLFLLTSKPMIYCANIAEDDLGKPEPELAAALRQSIQGQDAEILTISAQVEAEISLLDAADKQLFLQDLGIELSGLERLIVSSYRLLGLMSYLTAGPKEVRAWTIPLNTKAPQAAGRIHSDFERGFICAEVVAFDVLKQCGSIAAAKEKGLLRTEGRDYTIADGDVILFRFNV